MRVTNFPIISKKQADDIIAFLESLNDRLEGGKFPPVPMAVYADRGVYALTGGYWEVGSDVIYLAEHSDLVTMPDRAAVLMCVLETIAAKINDGAVLERLRKKIARSMTLTDLAERNAVLAETRRGIARRVEGVGISENGRIVIYERGAWRDPATGNVVPAPRTSALFESHDS